MPIDRRTAAEYLAASERFELERRGPRTGEFTRTLVVAVVVWVALIAVSRGNAYVVWFGWIVGVWAALAAPSVARWVSGLRGVDPADTDVREAARIEERRLSMAARGRYATDAELLKQARDRARTEGGPFSGSK